MNVSRRDFLYAGAGVAGALALGAVADEVTQVKEWEQTSDRKIHIGVVGGRFGLAFPWDKHPNCIVESVSDLVPDRRERMMERFGCERSHESLEKMVLDPKVEAIALFTPAPDHARHTILCMEHGKHVVSACPAVMSLEEAAEVWEVKQRTGLKYMQAETSYFRWPTIRMRELHAAGALGEIVYSEAEYYHPNIGHEDDGLSVQDGERTWRWGFPPMLYPTHSTAFLVGVTGERLKKVSCIGVGGDAVAFQDNAYNNPFMNEMAMFYTDRGHPFRCNVAWRVYADGERAQWFGDKGAVYMENASGQPYTERTPARRVMELPDYWPRLPEAMRVDSGHGGSHPFIANEFITALVEEREPEIDLEMGLAFCVPGIVAHQSSFRDGEQLEIPSFKL